MGSKGSYLITLPRRGSGFVLRVAYARWGQTPEDLRHLALSAPHARTRERALALDEITQGSCATRVAARTGRHPQTVMGWVHAYNAQGPDTLAFRRTGGRPPLYGAHYVKRNLLRANAVCWTKSGPASRLSGRRLAAPPCIRSALTGDLTTIPRAWARRGRESGTHLCNGTVALGGHRSTLVPLRREQPMAVAANLVKSSARRPQARCHPSHSATKRRSASAPSR